MEFSQRLELAIREGNIKVVDLLLKNGTKLDGLNQQLSHIIFSVNNPKIWKGILQLLIDYGLDYEVKKLCGEILLRYITFNSTTHDQEVMEVLKLLINSGLSPDDICDGGSTLLIKAVQNQNIALVSMAIQAGADTNKMDSWGQLPLHVAIESSNIDLVKLILVNGATINGDDDEQGKTALHIACSRNHEKLIQFFIKKGAKIDAENKHHQTPFHWLNHQMPNYTDCRNAMLREFALKQIFENYSINEKDLLSIEKNPDAQEYFDLCHAEIKQMASTKFYPYYSYYSVLKLYRTNILKMSRLTKNDKLVAEFEKNLTFFCYKNYLVQILNEAIEVKIISSILHFKLNGIFGNFLPDLVIRELVDYLTIEHTALK